MFGIPFVVSRLKLNLLRKLFSVSSVDAQELTECWLNWVMAPLTIVRCEAWLSSSWFDCALSFASLKPLRTQTVTSIPPRPNNFPFSRCSAKCIWRRCCMWVWTSILNGFKSSLFLSGTPGYHLLVEFLSLSITQTLPLRSHKQNLGTVNCQNLFKTTNQLISSFVIQTSCQSKAHMNAADCPLPVCHRYGQTVVITW